MTENTVNKEDIQKLGLNAIQEYFKIDLSKIDKTIINHLHNRAKIGMQFEREMSVGKRAIEMNYIRIFKMVAQDRIELKAYIKKSPMNKYLN